MAGKLQWALEISGVDRAAQQLRDLDKLASSPVGSKGIKGADFSGASSSFFARNPGLVGAFGKNEPQMPSQIPPKIAPPLIRNSFTGQNIMAGMISMLSGNNYLAARAFMSAGGAGVGGGFFGSFGGSGGAGGGGKSLLPAAAALAAVKAAAEGLRMAFEQLKEAVQRGSKLFQDAARVGRPVGQVFQLQAALRSVGIDDATANQLLLQSQFSRAGRSGGSFMRPGRQGASSTTSIDFEGMMLGTRNRPQQLGELQQLANLSDYARKAWKDAAVDAGIAAGNAESLFNVTFEESRLKREWNTLWEQFASVLSTALLPVIRAITGELKLANEIFDKLRKAGAIGIMAATGGRLGSGLFPGDAGNKFNAALNGQSLGENRNQFQRMGFIQNGGPQEQISLLRDISRNTGLSGKALTQLVSVLNATNPIAMVGAMTNHP